MQPPGDLEEDGRHEQDAGRSRAMRARCPLPEQRLILAAQVCGPDAPLLFAADPGPLFVGMKLIEHLVVAEPVAAPDLEAGLRPGRARADGLELLFAFETSQYSSLR